ncbi:MAG TPA: ribosome biogenesis GTP-binding protein YihA/YsxC [Pseudobacteroides sp.]|uniref:ribosome biogenesis GTP-binding protein YihA/YsxC n=1 Tax=Pseudobacteroides sp. TaxID=1968840 RepID=UPI002F92D5E8
MIIKNADFEITAVSPAQYPVSDFPEVAFVGRSNVGKSSILNTLTNRKNLARVGGTPGMTKTINFFNIDERMFFVDLPGYGYASVSKGKKSSWETIVEQYLFTRSNLKMVIMLLDIRHSPTKDDKIMYKWILDSEIPYIIVASKADKISKGQILKHVQVIRTELQISPDIKIIPFSSQTRQGKEDILEIIGTLL